MKKLIKFVHHPDMVIPVKNVKISMLTKPDAPVYVDKTIPGDLMGTVVALGSGKVGWSLCRKDDKFNKERGLMIAEHRAEFYSSYDYTLFEILENAPKKIHEEITKMYYRSISYFK